MVYIRKVHKAANLLLEEATKESLLPFGSWLGILPQAHEALELLHYLYRAGKWLISR